MSDTAELQALVNAAAPGSTIELTPNRVYVVAPPDSSPTAAQGVTIGPAQRNIRMHGSDTVIMQATGVPSSFSSLMIKGYGFTLDNVSLSGGAQATPVEADQHRHGAWVETLGARFVNVSSYDHTGDGFYCYIGTGDALYDSCNAFHNNRNGWTFGGACDGVMIVNCDVYGNAAQQVDTESKSNGQVRNLSLDHCSLISGSDYALTLGGFGFSILYSEINGGINITDATSGTIERCWGTNPAESELASVRVWGRCTDILMRGNTFTNARAKRGIWIARTDVGPASRVTVENNNLTLGADGAQAVQISGAISASVIGGTMRGNGVRAAAPGISYRSVNVAEPCDRFEVRDVRLEDFGQYGLTMSGPGAIRRAYVSGLSCGNIISAASPSLRTAIIMDNAVQAFVRGPGNVVDAGVLPLAPVPASVVQIQVP